jgi:CDP-glucose 4,6-dehydratase
MALVDAGASVVGLIYDEDPNSMLVRSGYLDRIIRVNGDVTDERLVTRMTSQYQPRTVFHLAAQSQVGMALRDPWTTFETNVRGTWNILEAARLQADHPHVIVASSDKAYGMQKELPYVEKSPLQGRFPYDTSKSCADLIAISYGQTFKLPVSVTRSGNIYGGGDLNWDRIVPGTIRGALRGERPVLRSDGTMTRDYVYVQDIVAAYLALGEHMEDPAIQGEAFNFGRDDPKTVLEIMQAALDAAGRPDLKPIILNEAKHEIQDQYLDATKAKRMLGWVARYTLEAGLRETADWYCEFLR